MKETLLGWAASAYTFLIPLAWIAAAIAILVFLPLAIFRGARGFAGAGMLIASIVIGVTTWFLGATCTLAAFGWFGIIVGLLLLGVGVVPMGVLGAFFWLDSNPMGWSIIAMVIFTFGLRALGAYVSAKAE